MAEDVKQNEKHNKTDMGWGTGRRGRKCEDLLRKKSVDVFD